MGVVDHGLDVLIRRDLALALSRSSRFGYGSGADCHIRYHASAGRRSVACTHGVVVSIVGTDAVGSEVKGCRHGVVKAVAEVVNQSIVWMRLGGVLHRKIQQALPLASSSEERLGVDLQQHLQFFGRAMPATSNVDREESLLVSQKASLGSLLNHYLRQFGRDIVCGRSAREVENELVNGVAFRKKTSAPLVCFDLPVKMM